MIRKKTLTTQVADEVRRLILTGEYKAGEQLRQDRIAGEMGVSRIPVREAFHQLASEGFVTLISHKGSVVAAVSVEEFIEFYELRARIETWLLALAIPNMTEQHFAKIEEAEEEFQRGAENAVDRNVVNWQFHKTLYEASGKPATVEILGRLHQQIERYTRMIMTLTGVNAKSHQEHLELIRLCRASQIDKAVQSLEAHIMDGSRILVTRLQVLREGMRDKAQVFHPGI